MQPAADIALADPEPQAPPTLAQIKRLESEMRAFPPELLADIDALTHHAFSPGIYARELHIPAGLCVVGKMHAREHFMVLHGDLSVWTDDGIKRLTGFHFIRTRAGTKRVGYAHADTVCITFHANPSDTQDLKVIEADHIVPEALEFERHKELTA